MFMRISEYEGLLRIEKVPNRCAAVFEVISTLYICQMKYNMKDKQHKRPHSVPNQSWNRSNKIKTQKTVVHTSWHRVTENALYDVCRKEPEASMMYQNCLDQVVTLTHLTHPEQGLGQKMTQWWWGKWSRSTATDYPKHHSPRDKVHNESIQIRPCLNRESWSLAIMCAIT